MCNIGLMNIRLMLLPFTLAEIGLSPQSSWDQNAITVAGWSNATSGNSTSQLGVPFGISIASSDDLYISDYLNHRIVVVHLNSNADITIIGSGPGSNPSQFYGPFDVVAANTSLYVADFYNHRVQKTSLNGSDPFTMANLSGLNLPYYLFVHHDEELYLSDVSSNRVLFFPSNSTNFTVVAGTGVPGLNASELYSPYGIFVNRIGTIYIADCGNHRIMKWMAGALVGLVVAGNGTSGSSDTQLSNPTQVIVDTNEYLYITEAGNGRITRWAPNSTFGVCIAACTGTVGIAPTELNEPHSLAFDSHGSLYVSDSSNNRVQKFQILLHRSKYLEKIHS